MKDYYKILGISENASQQTVKTAFRKLAFKHHPDINPGNEKQAEARFKEINEAYAVLGDKNKRQQYDYTRRSPFAGTGYSSFQSQQDIFQSIFSNQAFVNELNRMFSQAGLRFDSDFINQVFSGGRSSVFHFHTQPGSTGVAYRQYSPGVSVRKQNWLERLLSRAAARFSRFMLKKLLGIEYTPNLDMHIELSLTAEEIVVGGEKEVSYKRGRRTKRLILKIPPASRTGTKIRLKGMGLTDNKKKGDLYLHIKVTEHTPLNST